MERSLGLLGVDRLQLVYLHDPEFAMQSFEQITAPGGAVESLHQMKAEGVIDHVGIASGPTDLLIRYVETGQFEVVISHNRYTLLNREADPLWDVAARRGVATVNAAPYGVACSRKVPMQCSGTCTVPPHRSYSSALGVWRRRVRATGCR